MVHLKGNLETSIRAIIALALYPFPVRSANATKTISGIGSTLVDVLKDAQKEVTKRNRPYLPPEGFYSSAAGAALEALYRHEAGKVGDERYMSMEALMEEVNRKAHSMTRGQVLMNRGVEYYLDSNNLDPSWMQVSARVCSSCIFAQYF